MLDDEEEDVLAPKEPQADSNDPEERKEARRIRIKRRLEALRKAELPPEEIAAEEELGVVEQTTQDAAQELQRINLEGAAKVSNVKVITDEREVDRRNINIEKMKKLLDKIEEEAVETQLAYEAISTNWDALTYIKDPLDIDVAMKEQKVKCDALLEQKNKRVESLRADLKEMDKQYYVDLEKQDNDIKELGVRIERQLTIMQKAYEKSLNMIEEALNIERETMLDHNNKRWEALFKQRDKEEVLHIEQKESQLAEHKENIDKILWDHMEKYRDAKIELETLIQELQKELEKLKATCLINTEKIGYNYQVLKKREEENLFVRTEQKRKINKMTDVSNLLRAKIRKAAEDGVLEEIRAEAEIKRLMQAMDNLEKKSYQFSKVNDYKFCQVWRMSVRRCKELMKDLRNAEVALHAHVLAEPPPPPPPPMPPSPLNKKEADNEKDKTTTMRNFPEAMKDTTFTDAREKLVRHILQLVADNTGFLVEDRLFKLIDKYKQKSKNLCTLDAIFMALEIQAEQDIDMLCETFLNYAFCPVCVGLEGSFTEAHAPSSSEQDDNFTTKSRTSVTNKGAVAAIRARGSSAMGRSLSSNTSRTVHVGFRTSDLSPEDQLLVQEADEIIAKCGAPQAPMLVKGAVSDAGASGAMRRGTVRGVTVTTLPADSESQSQNPFLCSEGHNLEIEPMQLLTALSEFISNFVPPEKRKLYDILDSVKPPDFSTQSRSLTTEEIENYWESWKNMFPPEKERLWDGIIKGLESYLKSLRERKKLHDDVTILRTKNAALRQLSRGMLPDIEQGNLKLSYLTRNLLFLENKNALRKKKNAQTRRDQPDVIQQTYTAKLESTLGSVTDILLAATQDISSAPSVKLPPI